MPFFFKSLEHPHRSSRRGWVGAAQDSRGGWWQCCFFFPLVLFRAGAGTGTGGTVPGPPRGGGSGQRPPVGSRGAAPRVAAAQWDGEKRGKRGASSQNICPRSCPPPGMGPGRMRPGAAGTRGCIGRGVPGVQRPQIAARGGGSGGSACCGAKLEGSCFN